MSSAGSAHKVILYLDRCVRDQDVGASSGSGHKSRGGYRNIASNSHLRFIAADQGQVGWWWGKIGVPVPCELCASCSFLSTAVEGQDTTKGRTPQTR